MSTIFLFEDGHGNVVDENGGPKPMEYIVDQNEFNVETFATHADYLKNPASSGSSSACPMRIEKPKDADIRLKETNVKRDYLQRSSWAFTFELLRDVLDSLCPDSIIESCKQIGRKCILSKDHKTAIVNFIDANPSAAVVEVVEHLFKRFSDFKVSRSTVYNFMRSECNISLKKADFHSIERDSPVKIEERLDRVCKWENTDMNFMTNCVFLDESAFDINTKRSRAWSEKRYPCYFYQANYESKYNVYIGRYLCRKFDHDWLKKPRPAKMRKADGYISSGTVTSH
ncbi:Homeodomain-like DNA binding domain-containing transcription factor [Phycomyces blakesleeanus NRRL 1555(-)]|uniref:Homeodomain-like DNA binding domain-containing transcription factor n=1 Tax=Phycomyces blakesleeanus (strain ATCC 8743b / DSM 1359 / FGSC 10004 / NBRC 33097 / NRRL 1555) TaxID=763407 RepID=A0A162XV71_PHYB8|nr:Homeodomain-like DNA binding domain-containing transcription factor [Phycomyces blakesleeanus NRRL 1555(-)]OAD76635.1 Homeodomain-like DNA binding domain-containing transcription factor [Phycomyces blakesleeanus NRRL 1555(-)]|eukprot:XP_018294675.1 Homeodomain-like DNA binding domain-containing transcription factor [Phycomyces blakesleeanus NRRL 1555(-)]